jgi:hypothetical protein
MLFLKKYYIFEPWYLRNITVYNFNIKNMLFCQNILPVLLIHHSFLFYILIAQFAPVNMI